MFRRTDAPTRSGEGGGSHYRSVPAMWLKDTICTIRRSLKHTAAIQDRMGKPGSRKAFLPAYSPTPIFWGFIEFIEQDTDRDFTEPAPHERGLEEGTFKGFKTLT